MKTLRFYNSLSHKTEPFVPKIPGHVALYCCGITVYDHCHIGHGRMFVTTDLLKRLFELEGYRCFFIRNITDIDDKILNRAEQLHKPWYQIAETYTRSMQDLCTQIGCLPVDLEPKASESLAKIFVMIEILIEKGHAYVIDKEVFFSVETFEEYGALSHQNLDALEAGQRVAIVEHKKHPHDFTLWKPSQPNQVGWDSPWGRGRPGWHIECSAMIAEHVTGSLDFHIGGMDLKFPHHENEIAQSQCCYDYPLSKSWLHVGFVMVDGEKMSKSLNNFKYLSEFIDVVSPEVTRYLYLATQYRQPIALSEKGIRSAHGSLRSLGQILGSYQTKISQLKEIPAIKESLFERLMAPCRDDLNIPQALVVLHSAAKDLVRLPADQALCEAYTLLFWGQKMLGLDLAVLYKEMLSLEKMPQMIQDIAQERLLAREQKNYIQSDQLRQKALDYGYEIVDTAEGMMFKVAGR